MLYGSWDQDLQARLRAQIGDIRREAWGIDMSSNILRVVCTGLSSLYSKWPTISHDAGDLTVSAAIEESGLFNLMARVQRDTLGLREMLVRVEITADNRLTYRPVFPDLVIAASHPDDPGQPVKIKESRQRLNPHTGKYAWCWDECDISNPDQPVYRILAADGSDVTKQYLGVDAMIGADYPYKYADGRPFVPYTIYHAAETATLWDTYEWRELVEGSLSAAVFYCMLAHSYRQSSWPQRYMIGLQAPGAGYVDEDGDGAGRTAIVTDPATVLVLQPSEDMAGQPTVGQWQAGADCQKLQETALAYERRIASYAGIRGDLIRQSGDPRSGYALSVSRAAQREGQGAYEPMFRQGDLRLISISAAMLNRATGSALPESGYHITYAGIPLSPEEMRAQRDHLTKMLELGLMDKAEAYQQLHPGTSRADAINRLAGVAMFDSELESMLVSDDVAVAAGAGAGKAQDTALNGAQVTAAQGIVESVAAGNLPRETGVNMLASFFNMSNDKAQAIMGDVGAGFTVTTTD